MAVKGPAAVTDRVETNRDILAHAFKTLYDLDMRCIPKGMRADVTALRLQAHELTRRMDDYIDGR